MKQPYIKFWVRDWQSDTELRMCSLEARGLWIDLLCIMHTAKRRGYLESPQGAPLNDDMLCRLIGTLKDDLYRSKNELLELGVVSIEEETGIMYCRRMVKETAKSKKCAAAAKSGGGNPALKKSSTINNIYIEEARSHISLKATFKGQLQNQFPAAAAAEIEMVFESMTCRPEFEKLDPAGFFDAIRQNRENKRLLQNHREFVEDMSNSLSPPKVPAKLYARYLSGTGKPGENHAPSMSKRERPKFD
jgi:hypothetical protein